MKKFVFALLVSLFVITACSVATSDNTAPAASDVRVLTTGQSDGNVQLYWASSHVHTKYGQGQLNVNFSVRVKNIAYNKLVFVRHLLKNGQWTNISLSYAGTAGAGFENWTGGVSQLNDFTLSNKFAVGYTVNGVTYWDNNASANYSLPWNSGMILGRGLNVAVERVNLNATQLWVNIVVRNLAYNKTVKVVYTKNNWASSTVLNAAFVPYYTIGYSTVQSPTVNGFEYWQAIGDCGATSGIKLYVEAIQNGASSFDNDWGKDFIK